MGLEKALKKESGQIWAKSEKETQKERKGQKSRSSRMILSTTKEEEWGWSLCTI